MLWLSVSFFVEKFKVRSFFNFQFALEKRIAFLNYYFCSQVTKWQDSTIPLLFCDMYLPCFIYHSECVLPTKGNKIDLRKKEIESVHFFPAIYLVVKWIKQSSTMGKWNFYIHWGKRLEESLFVPWFFNLECE